MLMQTIEEDDAYNVARAVGHLVDLGGRMRSSNFGFKEQDVANIDVVIDAINELENQRSVIHDQLEAESIKSSILRHKLKFLPAEYGKEIHDAVVNARQSNNDLVKSLTEQLANVELNIEQLTSNNERLEKDNTLQLPERDGLRVQHEEVITVLNQRMAEKASKQIKLNETRDKLRNTKAKIMDFEDDLLQLKEDMIKERAEVRAEKASLRASINEAKDKTVSQTKENEESKSQLDLLLKRLDFTEKELDDLRKFIYKSETARGKAEGQERALANQINKQLRDNDELRKHILDLQRKKIETEQRYKADIETMQKHVEQLKAQIKAKEQRHEKLLTRKEGLALDEEAVSERLAASQEQVTELTEILNESKKALVRKQEDIARMREESGRMEQEIVELGETHVVCVENFNRQIEEFREQLGKERKERMEVQQKRDSVQKNLEEFKATNNRFMANVNKQVTQGKEKHENLTHEGSDLQHGLRELDEQIKTARVTIRDERLNYDLKKADMESQIAALKNEISRFEEMTKDARELLEIKIPELANQTEEFNESQVEFDKLKKHVTGMKSQKASLEDQVKRTRLAIEKAIKPQAEIRKEIQVHRAGFLESMKVQLLEAEELERQVYVVGTKLQTIADENQRFTDGNEKFSTDIISLQQESISCADDIEKLKAEYALLKALLKTAWDEDSQLEQRMTERDLEVLRKLADVLEISSKRTDVVSHVSEDMNAELLSLSNFLDTVADRRPKVTSEATSRADSGVNTQGTVKVDKAAQPSQVFFDQQQHLDDYEAVFPMDPPSGTNVEINRGMMKGLSRSSKRARPFNKKEPLPPINSPVPDVFDSIAPADIDINVDND